MTGIDLTSLRLVGVRVLAVTTGVLALVAVAGALVVQPAGGLLAGFLAVALTAYPAMAALTGRTDSAARLSAAASVVTLPALLLFVFQGAAWQIDLHMVFFAALAMVVILCDWRAIATATAIVAVHHLVVGLAMPQWVFLNGGSFGRILLHAVILLAEAGTLAWIAGGVVSLIAAMEEGERQRRALAAESEAERGRHTEELRLVVAHLEQGLSALAAGDLTRRIDVTFPGAFASLRGNFNAALQSLADLIHALGDRTAVIDGGAREIAQASEDLARRTETNAASLEQTTAAIGQIDARLRSGAAAAEETVRRADNTLATVNDGRAIADGAAQAMGSVSESAKGIDSVIEGLDKIAFQTRVLAMNAAVEAGRAGEAGRGFAVVADLVSALAMRAEEEAGRARDQLTATQDEIAAAVDMVRRVDDALAGIVTDVTEVHALLREMAAHNQSQASTMGEISTAIAEMDRATQQNAAMVEETSAAARNLTTQVAELARESSRFVIDGAAPPPVPSTGVGRKAPALVAA